MINVLVTGGCGFIGSKVVSMLVDKNYNVHVLDNLSTGSKNNIDEDKVTLHVMDINDSTVEDVFKEHTFRYVIHLAAQTSVPISINDIVLDTDVNILGSVKLIDYSRKYKVEKVIFASTAAIYGNPKILPISETTNANPSSPYGLSKYTVEKYLQLANQLYNLNYVILRYSNVYGPKQTTLGEGGVVSIFEQCFRLNRKPIIYGDGLQTRDFIYVDDVAAANIASLNANNGVYNISCNKQTSINELHQTFSQIYNKKLDPIYQLPREGDIRDSILSNELACEKLDWHPRTKLYDGLRKLKELTGSNDE